MLKANNGKFLSASSGDKSLRCNMDSRELEGAFQATPLVDGNFIFQSVTSKLFWRRDTDNDDWIIADTKKEAALEDRFCHFNASRVSKNMITIRCVGYDSGLFVLRSDNENKLKAVSSSVDNAATHFTVYDGTSNKHIFNVKYLLGLAEVTDIRPLVVGQGSVVNNGGQNADLQVQVSFTESVSTSNRWMTSQTVGLETSLTVSAGIPEIASVEATVTVGVEKTTETELGKEMTNLLTFQSGYLIKDVPPGGEAKVAVECTRGKCRVPFTYSTKATRLDGIDTKVEDEIGGVYEGVSIFNVRGVISGSAPSKPAATSKPATGSGGLVGSVVSGTGTVERWSAFCDEGFLSEQLLRIHRREKSYLSLEGANRDLGARRTRKYPEDKTKISSHFQLRYAVSYQADFKFAGVGDSRVSWLPRRGSTQTMIQEKTTKNRRVKLTRSFLATLKLFPEWDPPLSRNTSDGKTAAMEPKTRPRRSKSSAGCSSRTRNQERWIDNGTLGNGAELGRCRWHCDFVRIWSCSWCLGAGTGARDV
ncbi:hypothetical protein SELMODRAFT_431850 [Selaginella moellendorffii]|uniref:Agglutinin domain-containing protein n=1 Tax=Selaginella moellendorffii TaxID=88036 RepID=D8TE00_SELML|nr:hypothetical protein SELMODRAFT_431850 [Selaginella moellendorffii]